MEKRRSGRQAQDDEGRQGQGAPDLPGAPQEDQEQVGQHHDFGPLGGGRPPGHPGVEHHRNRRQQGGDLHRVDPQQEPGKTPQEPETEKVGDQGHHPQVQAVDDQQVAGAGAGKILAHLRGDFALVPQEHGQIDGPAGRVHGLEKLPDTPPEPLGPGIVLGFGQKDEAARVREPHLPEQAVRGQEAGAVEGAGVLQHVGRGQAPSDHQGCAHRRGLRHRRQHQEVAGGGPPAPGTPPGPGLHEELDPFPRQLAGPVQMAENGQTLVLRQFSEVCGRKIRLPGLLVEGHPQEPEQDQGQKPGRTPLPPEKGQGGPEGDRGR